MKIMSFVATLVLTSSAWAVHWGYGEHEGPDQWGELSPKFALCGSGKNQSPIDLTDFIEADLPALEPAYRKGGIQVVNNGHSIQVDYAPGSRLVVGGHAFELKQFHFHAPSENRIQGKLYPMEAHLVHADEAGNLAVVAVMITEGGENATLAEIWRQMPRQAGQKRPLEAPVSATGLLPASGQYYRYNGSLTTPPCSEGVRWYVLKQPLTVSAAQVEAFRKVMGHPNNRPVQPVNARPVLK